MRRLATSLMGHERTLLQLVCAISKTAKKTRMRKSSGAVQACIAELRAGSDLESWNHLRILAHSAARRSAERRRIGLPAGGLRGPFPSSARSASRIS